MDKTAINPYKYCKRTSIDGKPLEKGQVLVPVWLQEGYQIPKANRKYLTTYHYGEFKFRIGFMPQPIENYEAYMEDFQAEINKYLSERREGRCVIGHKPNGEPICCPKSRMCTGCAEKHNHERYNPLKDRYQILSLDYCYEDEDFDYPDENAIDPEAHAIEQEEESEDDKYDAVIAYFEKKHPRYATIIKMKKEQVPVEQIFEAIGVGQSRGYQELENAYNSLCDHLGLSCYKTKKNKK